MQQIPNTDYYYSSEQQALYRKSKYGQMNLCKPVRTTKDGTVKYRFYLSERAAARDYSMEEIALLVTGEMSIHIAPRNIITPEKKSKGIEPYDPTKCRIDFHKRSRTYEPRLHQYSLGHFWDLRLAEMAMEIAQEDYRQGKFCNLEPNTHYKDVLTKKLTEEYEQYPHQDFS